MEKVDAMVTHAHALGTVIRTLRCEHGLNQAELAKRLGKPSATVSAWELGKALPEAANLVAVAQTLGTTVSNLLVRCGLQEGTSETMTVRASLERDVASRRWAVAVARLPEGIPCFAFEEFAVNKTGNYRGKPEAEILRSIDNSDPHSYGLLVRGNALYPRFWDDDTVEVVTNVKVADGDVAVVIHEDGRKWIRRVVINRRRHSVLCEPLNPSDQSLEFPLSKVLLHLVISVKPRGTWRRQHTTPVPA